MLARPFCRCSGVNVRCRLSHCSFGAMRQGAKLKIPSGLTQVSRRSLLSVTTVICSAAGRGRTRRWMVIISSQGVDTRRVKTSLASTFEVSSIHVKEVKVERGSWVIGIRGEMELNERFRRERARPPRKSWGKQIVPEGPHTKA